MSIKADISGSFQRPTLVDYLIVVEVQKLSLGLHLYIGALEIGLISVSGGRVVYAEMPGGSGDTALSLLARLPNARVMPEPYVPRATNVQTTWRELVNEESNASSPGRSQRLAQIRAELREIETKPAATEPSGAPAEPSEQQALLRRIAADLLDWAAIDTYLQGGLERSRQLVARREQLYPGDLICAANLERLRLRLLEDEIAATVSEVSA